MGPRSFGCTLRGCHQVAPGHACHNRAGDRPRGMDAPSPPNKAKVHQNMKERTGCTHVVRLDVAQHDVLGVAQRHQAQDVLDHARRLPLRVLPPLDPAYRFVGWVGGYRRGLEGGVADWVGLGARTGKEGKPPPLQAPISLTCRLHCCNRPPTAQHHAQQTDVAAGCNNRARQQQLSPLLACPTARPRCSAQAPASPPHHSRRRRTCSTLHGTIQAWLLLCCSCQHAYDRNNQTRNRIGRAVQQQDGRPWQQTLLELPTAS